MHPSYIIGIISLYFGVLMLISYLTSRNATSETFFTGNKKSPWYIVAYGMIGAALSGVTFVSLPGSVLTNGFQYGQFLMGNIVGYMVITFVLIPLYYQLNLVSIYSYLEKRFGYYTYKTGSFFFLVSQSFGAGLRMLLAVLVLNTLFAPYFHVPIAVLSIIFMVLIFLYTFKAGIKTLVWTDLLQTTFLLLAVVVILFIIFNQTGFSIPEVFEYGKEKGFTKMFNFNPKEGSFFGTQFISGILISIAMMGLDQNMMQKSLTIKNVASAQKNTLTFSLSVAVTQFFFLFFGVLLFLYADKMGLINQLPLNDAGAIQTDKAFPYLAVVNPQFGVAASLLFILGIIAAAFSSADSALTALTTSFCYDFLGLDKKENTTKTRYMVHAGFSVVLLLIILGFSGAAGDIFGIIFNTAAYTYSPLLALFFLGILTKVKLNDIYTPIACISGPIITYFFLDYLKKVHEIDLGFLPILLSTTLIVVLLLLFKLIPSREKN